MPRGYFKKAEEFPINTIITDIHTHVLPNLDDGPGELSQTAELLYALAEVETHQVFCTSHYGSPHFDVPREALTSAYQLVSQHAATLAYTPTLQKGAEVRITSSLIPDIQNRTVPTLGNTSYVLIEFHSTEISNKSLDIVHELSVHDYQPIVAHPERNLAIQRNPKLIETLLNRDLLMQATAHCFTQAGNATREASRLAWTMLEQGYIHVIASDAHNTNTRPPGLQEAYERIATQLGDSAAEQLQENANSIWHGEPCHAITCHPKKSAGVLGRWFSKSGNR